MEAITISPSGFPPPTWGAKGIAISLHSTNQFKVSETTTSLGVSLNWRASKEHVGGSKLNPDRLVMGLHPPMAVRPGRLGFELAAALQGWKTSAVH